MTWSRCVTAKSSARIQRLNSSTEKCIAPRPWAASPPVPMWINCEPMETSMIRIASKFQNKVEVSTGICLILLCFARDVSLYLCESIVNQWRHQWSESPQSFKTKLKFQLAFALSFFALRGTSACTYVNQLWTNGDINDQNRLKVSKQSCSFNWHLPYRSLLCEGRQPVPMWINCESMETSMIRIASKFQNKVEVSIGICLIVLCFARDVSLYLCESIVNQLWINCESMKTSMIRIASRNIHERSIQLKTRHVASFNWHLPSCLSFLFEGGHLDSLQVIDGVMLGSRGKMFAVSSMEWRCNCTFCFRKFATSTKI